MDYNESNITLFYSDFNDTTSDMYRRRLSMRIVGSTFSILVGLTAVIGNLAVIFASYWDEALRSQTSNFLLVYLSMTDAITGGLAIIPGALSVAFDHWPFGDSFCRFQTGLAYTCTCSSSFNITFISIDRVLAVLKPLQYSSIMHSKRVTSICAFLFILGMSIMLPSMILNWSRYNYVEGVCLFDWDIYETRYFASAWSFVSCFYIPAICMFMCNVLIIFEANKKKEKKLFVRRIENASSSDSKMNKTIVSVAAVVIIYFITLAPYVISTHIKFSLDLMYPPQYQYFLTLLVYMSTAVNPFIYGIFRKDYRSAYKKILKKLSRKLLPWN